MCHFIDGTMFNFSFISQTFLKCISLKCVVSVKWLFLLNIMVWLQRHCLKSSSVALKQTTLECHLLRQPICKKCSQLCIFYLKDVYLCFIRPLLCKSLFSVVLFCCIIMQDVVIVYITYYFWNNAFYWKLLGMDIVSFTCDSFHLIDTWFLIQQKL